MEYNRHKYEFTYKNIDMSNKKSKQPKIRSLSERQEVVKPIILKLTELQLTVAYEPVRELFRIIQLFLKDGNRHVVNIPFPMINRRIKGELMPNKKADSTICLAHEKF